MDSQTGFPGNRVSAAGNQYVAGKREKFRHVFVLPDVAVVNDEQKLFVFGNFPKNLIFYKEIFSFAFIVVCIIVQIGDGDAEIIDDKLFNCCRKRQIKDMVVRLLISSDVFPCKRGFSDSADSVKDNWHGAFFQTASDLPYFFFSSCKRFIKKDFCRFQDMSVTFSEYGSFLFPLSDGLFFCLDIRKTCRSIAVFFSEFDLSPFPFQEFLTIFLFSVHLFSGSYSFKALKYIKRRLFFSCSTKYRSRILQAS